jgi:hypothetical protein
VSALTAFRRVDRDEVLFGYATGLNRVGSHRIGLRDDRGVRDHESLAVGLVGLRDPDEENDP